MPPPIDENAPIVPGEGLGGLRLRVPVRDYEELILSSYVKELPNRSWYGLSYPFEARYRLGPVEVGVDVRSGSVHRLTAFDGYKGWLFGAVRVGMVTRDAMQLDGRIYYDEAEELLLVRGVPGVSLDVPTVDPPVVDVPNLPIWAISVYAEEIVLEPRGVDQG